jgi:MFS family permease
MHMLRQLRAFHRPVQVLLLNQLAITIGFYMLMPYLTGYLSTTLGFTTSMVGLVLGLRTFSQQGLYVIGGALSDHVGYKPVIVGSCAIRMAGFLLFGYCDTLPSALGAAFLSGFGAALFAPTVRAYLASESGERRVEAFALFHSAAARHDTMAPDTRAAGHY